MLTQTLHLASGVLRQFWWTAVLVVFLLSTARAQSSYPTDGSTPSGLKPGAPAGSYALSGFDNINLYNGNLDFRLPLLSIGGRGGAGHTIMLPFEQNWQVETSRIQIDDYWQTFYYATNDWWETVHPGYGPGVMHVRYGVLQTRPCNSPPLQGITRAWRTLTRLTFTGADGTEYELRDQLSGGTQYGVPTCATSGFNRGKVFVTADGTSATFISDSDIVDPYLSDGSSWTDENISGYLLLRDGTRYRIQGGYVIWIRDRNGNKISFTYTSGQVTTITDSLNRQVTINYNVAEGGQYGTCDKINFKGYQGADRVIRVCKTNLGSALRAGYSLQSFLQLFPGAENSSPYGYFDPTVVSAVWLPNSDGAVRKYQVQYNSYGEVARVVLPTGGAVEYDHANGLSDGTDPGGVIGTYDERAIYRRVTERREYADGTNLTNRMTYSRPDSGNGGYPSSLGYVITDQLNASSGLLARQKHYFLGCGAASSFFSTCQAHTPVSYSAWDEGREYKTEAFDTNGTTVLRRVEHTWQGNGTMGSQTVNARIVQSLTTLEPSGANLVSKQTFTHDQYNNQTDVYEYDYGTGTPGGLVRRTQTSYLTTNPVNSVAYDTLNPSSSNPSLTATVHIRSLVKQVSVFDAGPVERSRATTEYDKYSGANHAALKDWQTIYGYAISGLCDGTAQTCPNESNNFTSVNFVTRGNATAMTGSLLTNGVETGSISVYGQFDIAGNVVKVIDGRGNATELDFKDRFGSPDGEAQSNTPPPIWLGTQMTYAFATKITNALGQTAYGQLDYYLGQPVNGEDANGIVAAGYYNDALDRPTQVRRAVSTSAESQTTFAYDDVNRIVASTSDRDANNDNLLVSKVLYDNLGRTTESRQYEGGTNYIVTKRNYDALGRAYQISNPYRPWQSESAVWLTTTFDALGRTLTATSPDNAVVTTSYYGNTVTATDQAGKSRKSVSDALGRLTSVYEDPSGLNYQTSYAYDVLNNLTTVTQGAQTRSFVYDSLKRLTSATNPESGTVSNTYDNNGNLLTRTDARNITTTLAYDVLNRPTSKSYNDSPQTPAVNFYYDAQTLPTGAPTFDRGYSTGALVAVTYGGGSSGAYRGVDQLGRVVRQYQQTDSINYLTEASYSVSGMTSETYPSVPGFSDRRTVSYTSDAAGRLASLNSNATTYAPAASVSSIGYSSHGGLKTETYGNGLIHALSYNNRLQPTEIKLGTSSNPTSVLSLAYSYGTTANNGNVQSIVYSGGGLNYTQSFTYDALNRLGNATETNGGTSWSQTNGYDRYGNRWIDLGGGNQGLYFTATTNRITGWSYDAAGNLLNDTIHAYTFDAENRISKVDTVTAYTYDGEGQRVRKLVGENIRFVYGIGGQLIMEFDGATGNLKKEYVYGGGATITIAPNGKGSAGVQYLTPDHLGSPRVVTNSRGTVSARRDYMPFGEELFAGVGGRTSGMGFSTGGADTNRKKFTGYERDTETGLDFAQARYHASTQERFTSPDALQSSAKTTNPQSFNRYAYVGNNPLLFTDPSEMSKGPAPFYRNSAEIAHARETAENEVAAAESYYEDRLAGYYDYIVEGESTEARTNTS